MYKCTGAGALRRRVGVSCAKHGELALTHNSSRTARSSSIFSCIHQSAKGHTRGACGHVAASIYDAQPSYQASYRDELGGKRPHIRRRSISALASSSYSGPLIYTRGRGAVLREVEKCFFAGQPMPVRCMSSWTDLLPAVPDFAKHWTIWGGSGILLKAIHHDGLVPYWACMAVTNVIVRSSLVPLVIQSAHTSTRFAKVAPEVQFLLTIFQKDMKSLKERNASPVEQYALMKATVQTLGGLYKQNNIHPFAVFKAPLLQLPVFWYFSIDIRKVINGADPELAQKLTEGGLLWVRDLTEPDPWYGLPILGGLLLYMNVEVALGKQILSGETTSKANVAKTLKDFFQSLAVFMPCFMAHQPAGIQVYLTTSFVFTMFQAAALRNDEIRSLLGLPKKNSTPTEAPTASEFIELKKFEQEAKEKRGSGELLGSGVLAPGWESSAAGTTRASSISGSAGSGTVLRTSSETFMEEHAGSDLAKLRQLWSPAIQVPMATEPIPFKIDELETNKSSSRSEEGQLHMASISEEEMEAANRGERPQKPAIVLKPDERIESPMKLKTNIARRNKLARRKKKKKK